MRWIKYGTQSDIRFTMVKRGVVDLAASADWTPAAADSAISKDGGNLADTTNTVAVVASGTATRSGIDWKLTITATEAQAAEINIQIVDAATKAVEDQFLTVYTYGNASAKFAGDWSDIVRLGLTALPNAAAEAAGGLYTRGTGAGQINQEANGYVSVNLKAILGTVLTETAGQIAGAFKKFFDKAAPTGTINSLPDAVSGAAGGLLVDDVWTDARAAKLDNLDAAISTRGTGVALDAAGVRAAVGLASANLDTQLAAIASYIDTEVAAILAAVQTLTVAERNAIADAVLGRNVAGGSSTGRTVKEALAFLRNKWTLAAGTLTVYDTDDTTVLWTASVTSDAAAVPVTGSDPA